MGKHSSPKDLLAESFAGREHWPRNLGRNLFVQARVSRGDPAAQTCTIPVELDGIGKMQLRVEERQGCALPQSTNLTRPDPTSAKATQTPTQPNSSQPSQPDPAEHNTAQRSLVQEHIRLIHWPASESTSWSFQAFLHPFMQP